MGRKGIAQLAYGIAPTALDLSNFAHSANYLSENHELRIRFYFVHSLAGGRYPKLRTKCGTALEQISNTPVATRPTIAGNDAGSRQLRKYYKCAFALFGDFSPSRQRSPSPLMAGLKHRLSETQADFVVSPFFQRFTRSGSQINGRERAI